MLPHVISDHCPLLVETGDVGRGHYAFKFENMWLKAEGFVEKVQQWWSSYSFLGYPSFVLAQKLKALKEDLKKWNKEEFGDLAFKKQCLLSELLGLDAKEDILGLSLEDQACQTQVKGEIEVLASLEETFWRQKSRALFMEEGDNNMHFFHRLANSHRRANLISRVEVEGVLYEDEPAVSSQVVQFYQDLYTETDMWRPTRAFKSFHSLVTFPDSVSFHFFKSPFEAFNFMANL